MSEKDPNPPKAVRFDKDDMEIVMKAAKKEGLAVSSYMRRVVMLYTREHHPELFEKS
jgi:hypothetical protein